MSKQLSPAQEHELVKSMLKLSPRALSIVVNSMGLMRDKHCFHRVFGPSGLTFMPRGKKVIDILDLFDAADQDYIPRVFSRPCDPAVPITLQDYEVGTLTSLKPGYMKGIFKIGMCDEDLDKLMLREFPSMPYRVTDMSEEQKMSVHIFAVARQIQGETLEARVRMFNHSMFYGAFHNTGPGIDKVDELIDLCRDPKQTVCLKGEGWANKYASVGKTLELLVRDYLNVTKRRCRPTDFILDEHTAALWEMAIEYQECGKCWVQDPNVIRRQELFNRNTLPSEDPFGIRGLKQFPYSNPRLKGINFWVCDEYEKTEVTEKVDGVTVGTGVWDMTPVMPVGSMIILDRTKLNSTALRGNIYNLKAKGSLDVWAETRKSCDGECIEYVNHTSPMDMVARANCVRIVYTDPVNCPPPCKCVEVECNPKGGKEAADAANPLRAALGAGDQSQVIAQLVASMKQQEEMVGDMKAENEALAEKLIQQSEDIAKLDPSKQVAAATAANQKNQKGAK